MTSSREDFDTLAKRVASSLPQAYATNDSDVLCSAAVNTRVAALAFGLVPAEFDIAFNYLVKKEYPKSPSVLYDDQLDAPRGRGAIIGIGWPITRAFTSDISDFFLERHHPYIADIPSEIKKLHDFGYTRGLFVPITPDLFNDPEALKPLDDSNAP